MANVQKSAYERTQRLRGPALAFRLDHEGKALGERARDAAAGRAGKTLAKEGALRITLVALRAGASLERHQVRGPASVQALSGSARVETAEAVIVVSAGGLLVLDAGVTHSVTALDDCTLLMNLVVEP